MSDEHPARGVIADRRWPKRTRLSPEQKAAAKAEREQRRAAKADAEFATQVQSLAERMELDPEQAREILTRFRDGEPIDDLAEDLGVMSTTLAVHFISSGVSVFRTSEYKR